MIYCCSAQDFDVKDFKNYAVLPKTDLLEAILQEPSIAIRAARYVFCQTNGGKMQYHPYSSPEQFFWYEVRDNNTNANNKVLTNLHELLEEKSAKDVYDTFVDYLLANDYIRRGMTQEGLCMFECLQKECEYKRLIEKLMWDQFYTTFDLYPVRDMVSNYISTRLYRIYYHTFLDMVDDYKSSLIPGEKQKVWRDYVGESIYATRNMVEEIREEVEKIIFNEGVLEDEKQG